MNVGGSFALSLMGLRSHVHRLSQLTLAWLPQNLMHLTDILGISNIDYIFRESRFALPDVLHRSDDRMPWLRLRNPGRDTFY